MYIFERQKEESISAYEAFIEYREGKGKTSTISNRKSKQIEIWKQKWNWAERKNLYEVYITNLSFRGQFNNKANHKELQELLKQLQEVLIAKLNKQVDDLDSHSSDSLSKIVSMSCKAIIDIAKAEKELKPNKSEETSLGKFAKLIRNNPEAKKLAERLSNIVYSDD